MADKTNINWNEFVDQAKVKKYLKQTIQNNLQ